MTWMHLYSNDDLDNDALVVLFCGFSDLSLNNAYITLNIRSLCTGQHGESCKKFAVWQLFFFHECSVCLKINQTFFSLQRWDTQPSAPYYIQGKNILSKLTGGNWQKWKRVFLTCPCHEIYRDEAVGLKICKNTWKITIFVKMWNLGQYRENLIFCQ